jgi:hypothetical protein
MFAAAEARAHAAVAVAVAAVTAAALLHAVGVHPEMMMRPQCPDPHPPPFA